MAKSKGGATVSAVWELCEPIVSALGLTLWDVRFVKEGADRFLRIYIDSDKGVGIDDCERVSRAVNDPLDALDPIEDAYILEVCSPGIERELVRDEHFRRFIGSDVLVKTHRPIDGIGKEFDGKLTAFSDGLVTVTDHSGENSVTLSKKDLVYIKLDDF